VGSVGSATKRRSYLVTRRRVIVPACTMASIEELLTALDERLLESIKGKSNPDGVAKLAEARAWLTNPDQPHGSNLTT